MIYTRPKMAHTSNSVRTGGTTRHSASTSRSAMIITGATSEPIPSISHIEPSYRLDPKKCFPEYTTQAIIKEVLEPALDGLKYDAEKCNVLCKDFANRITARVKSLSADRYKIVTFVVMGQEELGTMNLASRCLWNSKHDTYAEHTVRNGSMYAIGMVYGVYAE